MMTVTETPAADHASGYDLPGDVAELGELVAGLAAEIAGIASSFADVKIMADLMLAARQEGYARGVAASDANSPAARARQAARAQQRRGALSVVDGGKAARKPRRSGGAA